MKGWICDFAKWQIHPFISKGALVHVIITFSVSRFTSTSVLCPFIITWHLRVNYASNKAAEHMVCVRPYIQGGHQPPESYPMHNVCSCVDEVTWHLTRRKIAGVEGTAEHPPVLLLFHESPNQPQKTPTPVALHAGKNSQVEEGDGVNQCWPS